MRILLLIGAMLASGCAKQLELRATCANGLTLTASSTLIAKPFGSGAPSRLDGSLTIFNPGPAPEGYSNKYAVLAGARAYSDSPASLAIDFTEVTIGPGEKKNIDVYWPSQLQPGMDATNSELKCSK